jgi:hypothetical protein
MRDGILVFGLVLAFATLVTVHVAIVLGLLWRDPRWRALVAFLVPPLAPYWALRGAVWIGSVVLYTSLLGISAIG